MSTGSLREGRTGAIHAEGNRGTCYYCGRELISSAEISYSKLQALLHGYLTCGPCVYEHGRPPFRPEKGRVYANERLRIKRELAAGSA